MSDLITEITTCLIAAQNEYNDNKSFIDYLALKSKLGPDENKVSDFIVNKLCHKNEGGKKGLNREAVELLLDELATIDRRISDLNYRNRKLNIDREKAISNGRPDIIITVGNNYKIFIENKILATDQRGQMKRYHDENPKSLIYLTRFGHKASANSEAGLKVGIDYFPASYYKHIYSWICKLKEEQNADDVNNFLIWFKCQIHGKPDTYDLILKNQEELKSNIDIVKKFGDGFRQFVMWQRILPELRDFANENNLSFEVSDRFEFKTRYSYMRFITPGGKVIKFICGDRKNNTWSGIIKINQTTVGQFKWDFEELLDYDRIIQEIKRVAQKEIL